MAGIRFSTRFRGKGEIKVKKFYIIWKPGSNPNPSYEHQDLYSAEQECERLARVYGGSYFIMESVGGAKRNDVVPILFDDDPSQMPPPSGSEPF